MFSTRMRSYVLRSQCALLTGIVRRSLEYLRDEFVQIRGVVVRVERLLEDAELEARQRCRS